MQLYFYTATLLLLTTTRQTNNIPIDIVVSLHHKTTTITRAAVSSIAQIAQQIVERHSARRPPPALPGTHSASPTPSPSKTTTQHPAPLKDSDRAASTPARRIRPPECTQTMVGNTCIINTVLQLLRCNPRIFQPTRPNQTCERTRFSTCIAHSGRQAEATLNAKSADRQTRRNPAEMQTPQRRRQWTATRRLRVPPQPAERYARGRRPPQHANTRSHSNHTWPLPDDRVQRMIAECETMRLNTDSALAREIMGLENTTLEPHRTNCTCDTQTTVRIGTTQDVESLASLLAQTKLTSLLLLPCQKRRSSTARIAG